MMGQTMVETVEQAADGREAARQAVTQRIREAYAEAKRVMAVMDHHKQITRKQLEANRRNAQLSAGPLSLKGRARAAKNAIKWGLFAADDVVNGESRRRFNKFTRRVMAELCPVGEMEMILAGRLVSLIWRLRRATDIERQMMKRQARSGQSLGEIFRDEFHVADAYSKMRRYEGHIDRAMFRTWRKLERLQTERAASKTSGRQIIPL